MIPNALFQTNIAFDEMTKNALTAICKHICPMLKRQLVDQLPGGKYYIPLDMTFYVYHLYFFLTLHVLLM
jgi:hypothetical protein